MPDYTVNAGDTIGSIAHENGYLWKTIWDHGNNAALKAKRKDPSQLVADDKVFLPDKGTKKVSKPVDAKHTFTRKTETTKLKVRLLTLDEPRKGEEYTLVVDGKILRGVTDGDGTVEQSIPNNAESAMLYLAGGKESYQINIGGLDPIGELSGVRHRLDNLGFDTTGETGALGDSTRAALKRFQEKYQLPITGEPDGATRAKLESVHK
jgi:N-acetylmuramoyl-L-alanine amidase